MSFSVEQISRSLGCIGRVGEVLAKFLWHKKDKKGST
jgi:hypothetical protein